MSSRTVAVSEPVCLIENSENGVRVLPQAMEILKQIDQPVVVVAIVGLYRTGKSYLMNRLAGKQKGFALGSTIQSQTKGIWMWCVPHPKKENHTLVLLDTEGLGDVELERNDTWVFSLAVLLSSTLVYNSMGAIDNYALLDLHPAGISACTLVLAVHGFYSPSGDVVVLTPDNFNSTVLESDDLWVILFSPPRCEICETLMPAFMEKARTLKVALKVGVVDADQCKLLCSRYGIQDLSVPTFKIFGANKNEPMDYHGGNTAEALVEWAMNALHSLLMDRLDGSTDAVVELTDANFDVFVLTGEATWVVVFTEASCRTRRCMTWEEEWEAAAKEVKENTQGEVRFGAVNAGEYEDLAKRFEIDRFPTIKLFSKGKLVDYVYPVTRLREIVAITMQYNDPELVEILNGDSMIKDCSYYDRCIIFVLPSIWEPDLLPRRDYLDIINDLIRMVGGMYKMTVVAEKYKWLWVGADVQMPLEFALGIDGSYPAMAAINMHTMTFARLEGPFSVAGINKFLSDLSMGSGPTEKEWVFPEIYAVEAWDGKELEWEFSSWLSHAVEGFERRRIH